MQTVRGERLKVGPRMEDSRCRFLCAECARGWPEMLMYPISGQNNIFALIRVYLCSSAVTHIEVNESDFDKSNAKEEKHE